jgi:hypothetical protein
MQSERESRSAHLFAEPAESTRHQLTQAAWIVWAFTALSGPVFVLWLGELWAASPVLVLLYLAHSGPVLIALVTLATNAFSGEWRRLAIGGTLWPLGLPILLLWLLFLPAGLARRKRPSKRAPFLRGEFAVGASLAFDTVLWTTGLVLPLLWVFSVVWAPLRLWRSAGRGGRPDALQPRLSATTDR